MLDPGYILNLSEWTLGLRRARYNVYNDNIGGMHDKYSEKIYC